MRRNGEAEAWKITGIQAKSEIDGKTERLKTKMRDGKGWAEKPRVRGYNVFRLMRL